MTEFDLGFSASLTRDAGTFKLLELPPELCKLVESSIESSSPLSFSIKGPSAGDAVLCTDDRTYTIRSVVLSNTILVVTPPPASDSDDGNSDDGNTVVIRDQVNEILELTLSLPKLEKLATALKGREYDDVADSEETSPASEPQIPGLTYATAQSVVQASDAELARALRQRRILDIHGALRPIAPTYLATILEAILNLLVGQALSADAVPAAELAATLADENEISRPVSAQVMGWFGEVRDGVWAMDVQGVVREIGLGILRQYKDEPIAEDMFVQKWKVAVGDTFEAAVSLTLLSGNYLVSSQAGPLDSSDMLTYFPSSDLPVDPSSRFADLFLTRPRWKAEDIVPFLSDIAVSSKDRDKLLLKHARAITDSQGLWYTKR